MDKTITFCGKVSWLDKIKTELFDHNNKRYIWRSKDGAFKHNNTLPAA